MLKENTCFSKAISHAKVDLMCVPLSKIDREKKCKNPERNCMKSFLKEYSYFYAPVFSRDFFILFLIISRCNKKDRKIGQF